MKFFFYLTIFSTTVAFAQTSVESYKQTVLNSPFEQVFELGLKGVGSCKIVPAYLKGIRTWRVITSNQLPGVVGDGVEIGMELSQSIRIAHGYAWAPEFHTALAFPRRFFKPESYASFNTNNSKENAVRMLKRAINLSRCNISNSSLPEVQSVNISKISSEEVKQKFTFYLDSARNLKCTSTLHSKPVFNPSTCRYESKKVPLGMSACKKAFQKASVAGRATVTKDKTNPKIKPKFWFPPQIEAYTPEIHREFQAAALPFEDHVMAAHASEKIDIQAVVDPSLIVDYTKSSLTPVEVESGAKFKKYMIEAQGDYIKPAWLTAAHQAISARSEMNIDLTAYSDAQPIAAAVINDSKFEYFRPMREIYPNLNPTISGCAQIEAFNFNNIRNDTRQE
jgi:hypothetical protein